MASTLQLVRRIRTAQNVSKTTKAMQMIAASKLKKAQDAALSSRPYVTRLVKVTESLTKRFDKDKLPQFMVQSEKTGKTLYVVIAPDKGLCGGLVTNLIREVLRQTKDTDLFITIGKKIENPVAQITKNILASFPFGNTLPRFDVVYPIIDLITDQFTSGKVDKVAILSTHFVNIFSQRPEKLDLLPILAREDEVRNANDAFQLFEPDVESILPDLLKRYIEMAVYQEILESYLSEQSARMLSMQNATNNAKEIIEDLRLEYNKTRQAKITSELLDITGSSV